jgi:hypothetical protein
VLAARSPAAPFAMARVVWLTPALAAACPMNVKESHVAEPPEQNSSVVFDIPTERRTILPVGLISETRQI